MSQDTHEELMLQEGMRMGFRGYIFTNKKHPEKGIMSFILGILSLGTYIMAVYLSYQGKGVSSARYGAAGVLAGVFMTVGLILGIMSLREKETFKLFPVLGMIVNVLAFFALSLILYAGAYVG